MSCVLVDLFVLCACRLSDLCKRMFNELGSAVVQNVKFRDAWAFISQKGIQGFTDFEQVGVIFVEYVVSTTVSEPT